MNAKKQQQNTRRTKAESDRDALIKKVLKMNKAGKTPDFCPRCGGEISYDNLDMTDGSPFQYASCTSCGLEWCEEYKYDGLVLMENSI